MVFLNILSNFLSTQVQKYTLHLLMTATAQNVSVIHLFLVYYLVPMYQDADVIDTGKRLH